MTLSDLFDKKFNPTKVTLFNANELRQLDLSLLIIYLSSTNKDARHISTVWRKFWHITQMFDDLSASLENQNWGILSTEYVNDIISAYSVRLFFYCLFHF